MKIYISGLHSGPNPSPGVSVARSLRIAYPEATLIGVDYSNRSSGIHWPDFDEIWLQPPWDVLDLEYYASQIKEELDSGALWIPGLDLEVSWLAHALRSHPNLLIPPLEALEKIVKPASACPDGFNVPPFITTSHPHWELNTFCRRHDWRVWLKSPNYEAKKVEEWKEYFSIFMELSSRWSTNELILQAHIDGYEESIAFCAYRGRLIDCVYMSKRDVTPEGKTWSGHVSEVPEEIRCSLEKAVRDLNWTGGGELEFIRDASGNLWLLEWNPRFPAWIYGATIAGHNLPGLLVEAATGVPARRSNVVSREFTRIVLEIPVKPRYPLPSIPEDVASEFNFASKHPSGMPVLARRLKDVHRLLNVKTPPCSTHTELEGSLSPPSIIEDLKDFLEKSDLDCIQTPSWVILERTAKDSFERASSLIEALSQPSLRLQIAYSVKTNPDEYFLKLALEHGCDAEAISQLEVKKVLSIGFESRQIVLNGPGKWWPFGRPITHPFLAVFCDSLEELKEKVLPQVKDMQLAEVVGVRIRPPRAPSRFGIPLRSYRAFKKLISLLKELPSKFSIGLHFHIPSAVIGVRSWFQLYRSVLKWAQLMERASMKNVECLDVGGGWFPDDWETIFVPQLKELMSRAYEELPHLNRFIIEPGRALVQSCMALATRVLEVRRTMTQVKEVIVDASIAEVPLAHQYPHRILYFNSKNGRLEPLGLGRSRILGRLCMEDDILAVQVDIPKDIRVGDILFVCDVGAYDRSMAYDFGRG